MRGYSSTDALLEGHRVSQNRVQYQEGLSLSDFIQAYGTEEKCLAALELARWPARASIVHGVGKVRALA